MDSDTIALGKVVSILYEVRDLDGNPLEACRDRAAPLSYVHGGKQIPAGLEAALDGREPGAKVSVTLPPARSDRRGARKTRWPEESGLAFESVEVVAVREASPAELRANRLVFPFDLLRQVKLPGPVGEDIESLRDLSMLPPYPWGQWLYAQAFERCRHLAGDVIELGVGLGGMSLFLAKLAAPQQKRVFAFDSFEGLPPIHPARDNPYFVEGDYGPKAGSVDLLTRFLGAVARAGLTESIVPAKGHFAATTKSLGDSQRFCFAHLDSDLYDSVQVSLDAVYDRMSEGGVIVIDDFFHQAMGPQRAAVDFFNARKVHPVYHVSFPYSVFVIKGETWQPRSRARSVDGNWYSFEWLRRDRHFVEMVRASAARSAKASERAAENARSLLGLLEATEHRSSDIYVYWKAMEEFWDAADGFPDRAPGRI